MATFVIENEYRKFTWMSAIFIESETVGVNEKAEMSV